MEKRDSPNCIYCNASLHDEMHLLYLCPHLKDIWRQISNVFEIEIDYYVIITGNNVNQIQNQIISLLCNLIFRKFIKDSNNFGGLFQNVCKK